MTADDPLRGEPESPAIRRLIALLHRPRALVAEFFAGADRARAALIADPYPVAPTYRATDVTGWTVEELEDLASDDAWTEDLHADEVAAWEARWADRGRAEGAGGCDVSAVVGRARIRLTTTVSYTVTGAEPMRTDYSKRMFVPERVVITDRDGDVSFVVGGWVPKKDGTPSLNGGGKHNVYNTRHLDTEPEWLQNLVRDYCADAGIEDPS